MKLALRRDAPEGGVLRTRLLGDQLPTAEVARLVYAAGCSDARDLHRAVAWIVAATSCYTRAETFRLVTLETVKAGDTVLAWDPAAGGPVVSSGAVRPLEVIRPVSGIVDEAGTVRQLPASALVAAGEVTAGLTLVPLTVAEYAAGWPNLPHYDPAWSVAWAEGVCGRIRFAPLSGPCRDLAATGVATWLLASAPPLG